MIRTTRFQNFKGLRAAEVTFDSSLTILVGPNGSGKTSVLQGIEFLVNAYRQTWDVGRLSQYRTAGGSSGPSVQSLDDTQSGYGIDADVPNNTFIVLESGKVSRSGNIPMASHVPGSTLRPAYNSRIIAQPSITQATPPPVGAEGHGLPSLLGYLKLRDDELFDRIEEVLCRVIPDIRKLRVDRSQTNDGRVGEALLFDTRLGGKIPAEQMSDGTLYILALIVAILGPHRPKTLLIDDIDLRLHPKAQYELVTLLKQFLKEFPDLQIIATSHSPYILDKLEPSEVRVTGLADDGSVVVARLDEHPSFEKWKDSMSPGEFWSHTGEDWLKKLPRSSPKS